MPRLIARRIGRLIGVVFLISILVFLALRLTPGDPALVLMGPEAGRPDNAERLERLREELGLDRGLVTQYRIWVTNFLQGDLGVSNRSGVPVRDAVVSRMPATLALGVGSLLIAVPTSIVFGVVGARYRNGWIDRAMRIMTTFFLAVPGFWVGILMIIVFAVRLEVLPPGGYEPVSAGLGPFLSHLIMPAVSLAILFVGVLTRFVYTEMKEVLSTDYIRNAVALGYGTTEILFRHAVRNALLPMISVVGLQIGSIVGGVVLIESVFRLPGIGQLILQGVLARDYQMVQGAVAVVTVGVVVANYLAEIFYRSIDPRIEAR